MNIYRCECGMPIPTQGFIQAGAPVQQHPNLYTGRPCTGPVSNQPPSVHRMDPEGRPSPFCRCYMCQVQKMTPTPHNPAKGPFCQCEECKARLQGVMR